MFVFGGVSLENVNNILHSGLKIDGSEKTSRCVHPKRDPGQLRKQMRNCEAITRWWFQETIF